MSREVSFQPMPKRFKVWDTKENKFLDKQNWAILSTQPDCGVTLPYENTHNPENIDEDCIDWADADLLTGRYLICQSTNLFDKDGEEIFEGSIVLWGRDTGVVELHKGKWTFHVVASEFNVYHELYPNADMVEVIGHILTNGGTI